MKHMVSLVKDGRVSYAVVDDDSGQMVPFAEVLLPFPDSFGLEEAAVLGANLADAVGLNGKRPRSRPTAIAVEELVLNRPDSPPSKDETKEERRRRLDRERWHQRKRDQQAATKSVEPARRGRASIRPYITAEHVYDQMRMHPGSTATELAAYCLHAIGHHEEAEDVPKWARVMIMNRFTAARESVRRNPDRMLPFRTEEEHDWVTKNGTPGKQPRVKYFYVGGDA
jgi:hypothetical protein